MAPNLLNILILMDGCILMVDEALRYLQAIARAQETIALVSLVMLILLFMFYITYLYKN